MYMYILFVTLQIYVIHVRDIEMYNCSMDKQSLTVQNMFYD